MAVLYYLLAVVFAAQAAPPPQHYQQAEQLQVSPLDYYLDTPHVANYYQQEQRQANSNTAQNNALARLELVDPDTEVELIPGAQQPQQPPQQNPVAPNIPGLIPGQRVFIIHMPVPGIAPGTVGGYQPVYVVGAAPQPNAGNANYPGYQNPILLGPSGQPVSPVVGYQPNANGVEGSPNYLLRAPFNPYRLSYQEPVVYQPVQKGQEALRFSQVISLQEQPQPANEAKQNNGEDNATPQNARQVTLESKEQAQNVRPSQQSQRKA